MKVSYKNNEGFIVNLTTPVKWSHADIVKYVKSKNGTQLSISVEL